MSAVTKDGKIVNDKRTAESKRLESIWNKIDQAESMLMKFGMGNPGIEKTLKNLDMALNNLTKVIQKMEKEAEAGK